MHQAILAAAEGARDLARDLESIGSYSLAERARAVEQQLILSLDAQESQGLEVELGSVRTMAERSSLLLGHCGGHGRILEIVAQPFPSFLNLPRSALDFCLKAARFGGKGGCSCQGAPPLPQSVG